MTMQIKSVNIEQGPSRWQKARAWLTAIDAAIAYDPQEEADAIMRQLRKSVTQLEMKVADLEGHERGELTAAATDAVTRN